MNAAVQLHDKHVGRLQGAELSPDWGVVSTGDQASEKMAPRTFDGFRQTSWLTKIENGEGTWLEFRFKDDVCWVLWEYSIINGMVSTARDPQGWELQGSRDGETWTTIDSRKQQNFVGRRWAKTYRPQTTDAYSRYRIHFKSDGAQVMEVSEVDFTVKPSILPPEGVLAEAERGCAALKWQAVEGATGYTVRRAASPEGPYTIVASGVTETRYTDTGPFGDSETTHYKVSSELSDARGLMSTSVSVLTPVSAPTNLRVKQGADSVVLEWTPSPKAIAYVVRRSLLREGPYSVVGTMITAPAFSDGGLSPGTAYHYVVSGVANGKEGVETAPVSAVFPPLAPTTLTAEPGKDSVTLNWSAVALATSYKVIRVESPGETKAELASVTDGTTFTDATASPRRSYVYTVVAVNDCGTSAESPAVSATAVRPASWWRR